MKTIKDKSRMVFGGYRQPSDGKRWNCDEHNIVKNYLYDLKNIIETLKMHIPKKVIGNILTNETY